MDRTSLGRAGEDAACSYLRRRHFHLLERNYRTRLGEIDLIMRHRHCVVFVEVKLRRNADFGEAREFVNGPKQARIMAAAESWLAANPTELQPRFDIVEIYTAGEENPRRWKIQHWENAFP